MWYCIINFRAGIVGEQDLRGNKNRSPFISQPYCTLVIAFGDILCCRKQAQDVQSDITQVEGHLLDH